MEEAALVKGSKLEMEEIQLCLRNWGQETRLGTDQVQGRGLVGLQGHYGGGGEERVTQVHAGLTQISPTS